jgi:hypothetical protein
MFHRFNPGGIGFAFHRAGWLKISPWLNPLRSFSLKNLTGRAGQAKLIKVVERKTQATLWISYDRRKVTSSP